MNARGRYSWTTWVVVACSLAGATSAAAQDTEERPIAGYDGGFFVQTADGAYRLRINGLLQPQFMAELPEEGDNQAEFRLRRGRLKLSGHAFDPRLGYTFQAEFAGSAAAILDYYVNYAILPDQLVVQVGRFKHPLSRQFMISSSRLGMVDRAPTSSAFGAIRDVGLAFQNDYMSSPGLEWVVGLFNGEDQGGAAEGDLFNPALVVRLGINTGGIRGYSEADLEGGPLRFAVAASARADFDADGDDDSAITGGLDYVLKVSGLCLSGEVLVGSHQDGATFGDRSFTGWGIYNQLSYVFADHYGAAFRHALVDPDGDDNHLTELVLALNWYIIGHKLKWQTDVAALISELAPAAIENDATDWRIRSQLTLAF